MLRFIRAEWVQANCNRGRGCTVESNRSHAVRQETTQATNFFASWGQLARPTEVLSCTNGV